MLQEINSQLLFGAAGLVGAGIRGLIAYFKAKHADSKVTFNWPMYSDTLLKGVATGLVFSIGLPVIWASVGVTALAATGVDTYLNKFNIKIIPVLTEWVKSFNKSTGKKR